MKTKQSVTAEVSLPTSAMAVMPLLALVVMLGGAIYIFGDGTIGGPAQIALIISGVLAGGVGVLNNHSWNSLEAGAASSIQRALPAIFIL